MESDQRTYRPSEDYPLLNVKGYEEKGIISKQVIVHSTAFPENQAGERVPFPHKDRFRLEKSSNRITGVFVRDGNTGTWEIEPLHISLRTIDGKILDYLEEKGYKVPRLEYQVYDADQDIITRCTDLQKANSVLTSKSESGSVTARIYYETEEGREYLDQTPSHTFLKSLKTFVSGVIS